MLGRVPDENKTCTKNYFHLLYWVLASTTYIKMALQKKLGCLLVVAYGIANQPLLL